MYDPAIGRWNGVDVLAEKYCAVSPFVYANNDPVMLNDIDGKDIDISSLNDSQKAALAELLKTAVGRTFFAQFAKKGEFSFTYKGGKFATKFEEDGNNSNDVLSLVSKDAKIMNKKGLNGVTDELTRDGKIPLDDTNGDYDIEGGIRYQVNIKETLSKEHSASTMAHELFVHVDPAIHDYSVVKKSKVKPHSIDYMLQLNKVSDMGNRDHARLARGEVRKYLNATAQIDKNNKSSSYSALYKEDVKKHGGR